MIAVVVYGLYGASSYQFSLSSKGLRSGAFFKFFDVLSFMLNGMVFFYVGASIVNFYLRWGENFPLQNLLSPPACPELAFQLLPSPQQ